MKNRFLFIGMLLSIALLSAPLSFGQSHKDQKRDTIYAWVDQMPEFFGGQKKLEKFIRGNLRYPQNALKNKVSGIVYVSFLVKASGTIEEVTIAQGVDPECDQEAIRLVKAMPRWKPGRSWKTGDPIDILYSLPILFSLPGK